MNNSLIAREVRQTSFAVFQKTITNLENFHYKTFNQLSRVVK